MLRSKPGLTSCEDLSTALYVFHIYMYYFAIDSYVIFHSACLWADADINYEQYISHGYSIAIA